MSRKEAFDFGRVPAVLYHGADRLYRDSIASKGLRGGHVTDDVDLAAEYAAPDLYEVRKHPNIVQAAGNGGADFWDVNSGVYWANNVPPSHIRRVGHVIAHLNEDGEEEHHEVHWHLKEECPIDYDMTHPLESEEHYGKNTRPHPTDPNLLVSDY